MEGGVVTIQEIFIFKRRGKDEDGRVLGEFTPTGIRPKATEALVAAGIDMSRIQFTRGAK